jgi:outer membrane protein assembly factor BamE
MHAGDGFDMVIRTLLAALLLAGCQQVPMLPSLSPHKIEIQQGNYVTQEMVAKLQPGMTRSQVRFILGTPLVVDPFRTDRWDYVYVLRKQGEVVEQRRIVMLFRDDRLARIEGDVVPGGGATTAGGVAVDPPRPAAAEGARPEPKAERPKPEPPQQERGFFGRMLERIGW